MEEKEITMEVVNPKAAGVDIGSRSHWVAIGQGPNDYREFGVFNEDLYQIVEFFRENGIKTVAMESTSTYWQSLYAVLISENIPVILCNGKFIKNIKGKKTDIQDCQWIQKLHSMGLLTGICPMKKPNSCVHFAGTGQDCLIRQLQHQKKCKNIFVF